MEVAKVFTNGGSQAVRLPKDLMPRDNPWISVMLSLDMFTEDFLADGIDDLPIQERALL